MSRNESLDFARVYAAYHGRIVAFAEKLVGPSDAEDVAQEVFVKVDRSLATLADPSKLSSWVYAITINSVRDALRRRSSRPEGHLVARSGDPDDEGLARIPDRRSRGPEEGAMRNEMIACYLDFVRRLPSESYEVYALKEFEHLSDREIAQRLSLSLAAVKMRLHRARARLHRELACHCQPYYNERGELMGEPRDR